jgi:Uma2 family endonuclease
MPIAKKDLLTVEEYLAHEKTATVRHEYVNGRLFAMTGGTRRHNLIAGKIYATLLAQLHAGPCRAYINDVKVRAEKANSFYYPDVMVSCDAYGQNSVFTSQPVLIVEVLSPSTAKIDLREKVLVYTQIDSLREYMIVHQKTKRIQLHRRNDQGSFDVFEYGTGDEILLESIPVGPVALAVDSIYQNIDYPGSENPDLRVREESEFGDGEIDDDNEIDW